MTHLAAMDNATSRKARGAFFTPEPVARYITEWAVQTARDRVLEPSCGEAAFLLAAANRQRDLGGRQDAGVLDGVELHARSAEAARELLRSVGATAQVQVADFFTVEPAPTYDAVIGNPPYVRYQGFTGEDRARARAAALRAGVSLTNLASSWAAFTVHAALFLRPGGRLGLVLPAELLTVNYAAGVRRFLMQRFARVRLVLFTERVFPGVLEEVVLLLAEGEGPTDHCELLQVHDAEDLLGLNCGRMSKWSPVDSWSKWSGALVPGAAAGVYNEVIQDAAFGTLHTWGETTLGMVTGANRYFALSPARVRELQIPEHELVLLSPPGSRHLRGLSFTTDMRKKLGEAGASTYLFRPSGDPGHAAAAYVKQGEADRVDQAYKCRVRKPWWRVPYLGPADLFLTYMNADTPRLTTNLAGVHHLNSVHGVYLHEAVATLGRQLLPLASLNTATLLGAETVGRAYGGGMLKIEPGEADLLPMPSPAVVEDTKQELQRVRGRVTSQLRDGRLMEAVRTIDQIVLVEALGLTSGQVSEMEQAHAMLTARRMARGAKAKTRS